jgi:hypothetical protein
MVRDDGTYVAGDDQMKRRVFLIGLAALAAAALEVEAVDAAPGHTEIAKWKDDRTGVFLLMFDDSWPSHWQVAIPELQKRGLIATFYINPGKGEYKVFAEKWEKEFAQSGMVYGDHTMTHKGVKDLEDAKHELGECARVIRQIQPGKENRLVSYGQPGVPNGSWNITQEELDALLKEYNLVSRPPFAGHGAVYHQKTLEEMTALVDKAIAEKGMNYLVVHGVERIANYQDMWPLKQDIFFPLLDYMKQKSDAGELWVTDHITQHQYETERSQAEVKALPAGANRIRVELKCLADPQYYDLPLTLVTAVPKNWRAAMVSQGGASRKVPVVNGVVKYDAVPNGPAVELTPTL